MEKWIGFQLHNRWEKSQKSNTPYLHNNAKPLVSQSDHFYRDHGSGEKTTTFDQHPCQMKKENLAPGGSNFPSSDLRSIDGVTLRSEFSVSLRLISSVHVEKFQLEAPLPL
jgi:hypothetical protein